MHSVFGKKYTCFDTFFSISSIEHLEAPVGGTDEMQTRLAKLTCLEEALSSENPGWREEEAKASIHRAVRRSEVACQVTNDEYDRALSSTMGVAPRAPSSAMGVSPRAAMSAKGVT